MAERDGSPGFGTGFVVGAIIGLAIGFLYAPKPGEETRELARESVDKVREKAMASLRKLERTASEAMEAAQTKLKELEKVTERAAAAAKEAEPPAGA
jgi:gas vesicle protein